MGGINGDIDPIQHSLNLGSSTVKVCEGKSEITM
jgi:hypothetical protein